jgi:hypothetical protein
MWPFKRKQESPQEIAAEKKLDEATREVAWDEFGKEAVREQQGGFFGPLKLSFRREKPDPLHHVEGDPVPEPVDDSDPGDERGLRDALRGDEKT